MSEGAAPARVCATSLGSFQNPPTPALVSRICQRACVRAHGNHDIRAHTCLHPAIAAERRIAAQTIRGATLAETRRPVF